MGSSTKKTKSQETATTTPNIYTPAQGAMEGYYGNVTNLMNNPTAAITPANSLQTAAWAGAGNLPNPANALTGANNYLTSATGALSGVTGAKTTSASLPANYNPATVGNVDYGGVAQAQVAQAPKAAQVDASGILDSLVAAGYGGANIKDYISDFQNPYTQQVVDATMADLTNQQGIDRARYAAQGAKAGAFGGSRFGIGETNLMDSQSRTRATTQAQLRSDAWNAAIAAAAQQAGLTNAAGIASMQSANSLSGQRAGLALEAALANQGATNDFAMAGFNADNQANLYNTSALNDAISRIYGANVSNAQQDAGALNNALSQFYSGALSNNQFNAGQANQNSQFNQNLLLGKADAYTNIAGQKAALAGQQNDMTLANLNAMAGMGAQQYGYENQYSPYSYLGALGGLLDPSLIGLGTGQTINTSGTSTSKESGGLGGTILGGLFGLGSAYLGGK